MIDECCIALLHLGDLQPCHVIKQSAHLAVHAYAGWPVGGRLRGAAVGRRRHRPVRQLLHERLHRHLPCRQPWLRCSSVPLVSPHVVHPIPLSVVSRHSLHAPVAMSLSKDVTPAGIWTGAFFILFGIFAKLSAFFVSIPDCLNGGLLIIIAAIVMGPGVRVRTE